MIYWFRRFGKIRATPPTALVFGGVLPLYLATVLLAMAALGFMRTEPASQSTLPTYSMRPLWLFAVLWCVVIPILGWAFNELRWRAYAKKAAATEPPYSWPWYDLLGLILSGALAAVLLVMMARTWLLDLYRYPALYVVCTVPLLLGLYLLARTVFVAIAGLGEGWQGIVKPGASDDADREWWARFSGWVLLTAFMWLALSAWCILGGYVLEQFKSQYLPQILGAAGGVFGLVASLLGMSRDTASGRTSSTQTVSRRKQCIMVTMASLCIVALFIFLSRCTALLGNVVTGTEVLDIHAQLRRDPTLMDKFSLYHSVYFLLVPLGLTGLALLTGCVVNVNRFSLHGVYRNRLIRAYLGASNSHRHPDPFTGFDADDNPKLHDLWDASIDATRPLPVINAALNLLMSEEKLAWQQRKSESFSMTPFYCGNFHEGYRASTEYGGPEGLSVGTAVAISGAAANPNMGTSSLPVISFLMALFNARLGAWLGNTNTYGNTTYRLPGPRQAIRPLLAELFGLTSARSRYINLSDGGHFDNLGIYEMVLRRCRFIVISDAGQDPQFTFEDLGNVIRKIRIDFAVPIVFTNKIRILPRSNTELGFYCATAIIDYQAADGGEVENGQLLYFKPALEAHGNPIPYDVYSYAQATADFPHESTADQWFSEAQFESYRALGFHVIEQIRQGHHAPTFATLIELVNTYMGLHETVRMPDVVSQTQPVT